MKNLNVFYALFFLVLLSCNASKKIAKVSNVFVDAETPKTAQPVIIDTSTNGASKKEWVLNFSDEFNDNKIDNSKWTIENSTKKRVDVTLYSDCKLPQKQYNLKIDNFV